MNPVRWMLTPAPRWTIVCCAYTNIIGSGVAMALLIITGDAWQLFVAAMFFWVGCALRQYLRQTHETSRT